MNELTKAQAESMATYDPNKAYGFEETNAKDIIIPRIKVINALSPERLDGEAVEGDVINSLTKESIKGERFVPIKQYYSNIQWNPERNAELRIFCRSFDGRIGNDGTGVLTCAACKKNMFDNTKTGREAQPLCTAYLNFLGFFEGNPMPVVLSFAKTNYNEGKKLLSIARSMRCAVWSYAYSLDSRLESKDKNKWYNIIPKMAGETSPETRALAFELFKAYEATVINADYEDTGAAAAAAANEIDTATAEEI